MRLYAGGHGGHGDVVVVAGVEVHQVRPGRGLVAFVIRPALHRAERHVVAADQVEREPDRVIVAGLLTPTEN